MLHARLVCNRARAPGRPVPVVYYRIVGRCETSVIFAQKGDIARECFMDLPELDR